jgi:hypothetical protein
MILGGLWHGANWTFLCWGLAHGLFLVINHSWQILRERSSVAPRVGALPGSIASHALTLICVVLAWILFRAESIGAAGIVFQQLLDWNGLSFAGPYEKAILSTDLYRIARIITPAASAMGVATVALLAGWFICLKLPNTGQLFSQQLDTIQARPMPQLLRGRLVWAADWRWALVTVLLLLFSFLFLSEPTEFLYFQF